MRKHTAKFRCNSWQHIVLQILSDDRMSSSRIYICLEIATKICDIVVWINLFFESLWYTISSHFLDNTLMSAKFLSKNYSIIEQWFKRIELSYYLKHACQLFTEFH